MESMACVMDGDMWKASATVGRALSARDRAVAMNDAGERA